MMKKLLLTVSLILVLCGCRSHDLNYLEKYFDISFGKYEILSEVHRPGRDWGYIYTVSFEDERIDDALDPDNFEQGYTEGVRELIRLMKGECLPDEKVRSILYKNKKLGHQLAVVYVIDTGEYILYFQTF
ncbi:MAG: hypothetical protein IIZ33_07445 [Erysipelotrichaceae bacterium]|nr:hypothetical protein [Erysipelotrichaceae bacterium]